jgi:hypothetical protein
LWIVWQAPGSRSDRRPLCRISDGRINFDEATARSDSCPYGKFGKLARQKPLSRNSPDSAPANLARRWCPFHSVPDMTPDIEYARSGSKPRSRPLSEVEHPETCEAVIEFEVFAMTAKTISQRCAVAALRMQSNLRKH